MSAFSLNKLDLFQSQSYIGRELESDEIRGTYNILMQIRRLHMHERCN